MSADMSWRTRADCLGASPALWYPAPNENATEAKRACAVCPVRIDCLNHAYEANELFGVWGGLTAEERLVVRKRRRHMRTIFDTLRAEVAS